ncbi:putative acetyltransferase C18B11.09c [Yarrowia sp. B02]|nr:putative acetyltransferase C18B11.09c [Yarrowia sp. B02]
MALHVPLVPGTSRCKCLGFIIVIIDLRPLPMPSGRQFELSETEIAKSKKLNHVPHCDDYDKMISSVGYHEFEPPLVKARHHIHVAQKKYNEYFPEDISADQLRKDRTALLEGMVGHVGKNSYIEAPVFFDYGCNFSCGEDFVADYNCVFLDCALITIGDRVIMGPGVKLITATHDVEVQTRRDGVEYAQPINIGDDCWLGSAVQVMPGVTIGNGSTIGAGSIVTKDIPPYSVAMGVPAKVTGTVQNPDSN